jgi:pimeloyl-ACP methyl ester carboxylesterase
MRIRAAAFLSIAVLAAPAADLSGTWQGNIVTPGATLHLGLTVAKTPAGYKATIDSYDHGGYWIPAAVKLNGTQLHLDLTSINALYDATLSADGKTLTGTWTQGGNSVALNFTRAPGPKRPQEPKPPFPYRSEDVTYQNTKAAVKLAGTLTLPPGSGPFPAVLLITGSGAQDRDEKIFGHKPFLVIADFLTRRGIAVLRVDDRGVGGSTGDLSKATEDDLTDDALAGVNFLRGRADIQPARIGLIGHSEGADIAARAAPRSDSVAFIVMLGGTGIPGEELLVSQGEAIMRASGASDDQIKRNTEVQRAMFRIVREQQDSVAAEKQLRELLNDYEKKEGASASDARAFVESQLRAALSPSLRSIILADPASVLRKVTCPVLALNGSRDLQVLARLNLPAIAAALAGAGNQDYEIAELPMLNHLFQKAGSGLISEYAEIEQTFAPEALEIMNGWIQRHVK